MATKPNPVTLRARYTDQAAADLAENRRRQAELMSHLEVLRQEETLLLDIINLTQPSDAEPDPAPVLPQSASAEQPRALSTSTPEDVTSDHSAESPAGQLAPRKAVGRSGGTRQPLLREVLLGLLRAHNEPRAAKDVWEECLQKHPDRSPSHQVVRNTLEGLVARGTVARHKQGRSVMYSLTESS